MGMGQIAEKETAAVQQFRLENMAKDIGEIKTSLGKMTEALTKLALVEERQATYSEAQSRAFAAINDITRRVHALEVKAPENARVSAWIDRTFCGAIGVMVMYVLKSTGVL